MDTKPIGPMKLESNQSNKRKPNLNEPGSSDFNRPHMIPAKKIKTKEDNGLLVAPPISLSAKKIHSVSSGSSLFENRSQSISEDELLASPSTFHPQNAGISLFKNSLQSQSDNGILVPPPMSGSQSSHSADDTLIKIKPQSTLKIPSLMSLPLNSQSANTGTSLLRNHSQSHEELLVPPPIRRSQSSQSVNTRTSLFRNHSQSHKGLLVPPPIHRSQSSQSINTGTSLFKNKSPTLETVLVPPPISRSKSSELVNTGTSLYKNRSQNDSDDGGLVPPLMCSSQGYLSSKSSHTGSSLLNRSMSSDSSVLSQMPPPPLPNRKSAHNSVKNSMMVKPPLPFCSWSESDTNQSGSIISQVENHYR